MVIPFKLKPVPQIGTFETFMFEVLSLVSVMVSLRLLPTVAVPKFSLVGLTASSVAAATPENIGRAIRITTTKTEQSTYFGQRPALRGSWLMVFFTHNERILFRLTLI